MDVIQPQREQFLSAVRKAYIEDTPAVSTYYPGSGEVAKRFAEAYPDAEVLQPEHGAQPASDGLLITRAAPDSFAVNHEAFCQVIAEVPLDVPADADAFLPAAVSYSSTAISTFP